MRTVALCLAGLTAIPAAAMPARADKDRSVSLPIHGVALRGDVDGDGRLDTAGVHCRPGSVPLLLVYTAQGTVTRALTTTGCGTNARVVVLARIDRVPGAEVVVREGSGSAFFARVYTLRNHRLALMKVERPAGAYLSDTFTYGGAAAHDASVDCVRPASGDVVVSSWQLGTEGNGGIIERSYPRVVATEFRMIGLKRMSVHRDHRRYGGFTQPELFPGCALARAPEHG